VQLPLFVASTNARLCIRIMITYSSPPLASKSANASSMVLNHGCPSTSWSISSKVLRPELSQDLYQWSQSPDISPHFSSWAMICFKAESNAYLWLHRKKYSACGTSYSDQSLGVRRRCAFRIALRAWACVRGLSGFSDSWTSSGAVLVRD
jgi:hypothetical protein